MVEEGEKAAAGEPIGGITGSDIFLALNNQDLAQLNRFQEMGAIFDYREEDSGYGPILWTVSRRKRRALKWLLEHGKTSSLNDNDDTGWSPLHYAARHGDEEMVKWLLEAGASCDSINYRKQRAADVAKSKEIRAVIKEHIKKRKQLEHMQRRSKRSGSEDLNSSDIPRSLSDLRSQSVALGSSQISSFLNSRSSGHSAIPNSLHSSGSGSGGEQNALKERLEKELARVNERDAALFAREKKLSEKEDRLSAQEWTQQRREKDLEVAEARLLEIKHDLEAREARLKKKESRDRASSIKGKVELIKLAELKLAEEIGRGGFGVVHRAMWRHCHVAVKFQKKEDGAESISAEDLKAFETEVVYLAQMRHPNIIPIMAAGIKPPRPFFVMPLMQTNLSKVLHNPALEISDRQKLKWAIQIASSITYLHSRRPAVIHRDLKPENCLLDDSWTVQITDLGLVRASDCIVERDSNLNNAGSFQYMAPECLREEPYSELADVYSFGVTLWEIALRQRPWTGHRKMEVVSLCGFSESYLPLDQGAPILPIFREIIAACFVEASRRPKMHGLLSMLRRSIQRIPEENGSRLE